MFWFYFDIVLWFLWQLPQNIVALLMMPFIGKLELIRFENYCWVYKCSNMRGGISLGNFIFLSTNNAKREVNVRHELGHTVQSHRLGPLYLFTVGLCSLLNAIFGLTDCYYDFWTEARANAFAGLRVIKNQYGCSLYIPKENK